MTDLPGKKQCDVAIIGAGPAGIAAALELKRSGIDDVIILDRETSGGGVPRHCGHPPFGLREYARIMTGPQYAGRNVEEISKADIPLSLRTSVTALGPDGTLSLVSPRGKGTLKAKRVLLATGTRETPRSARFIPGDRPLGICTTGALQSMVYLKNMVPFYRPLVIGTEIVSFSALWTCKKAGITPVAMVEEHEKPVVSWPVYHSTRYFGVPLLLGSKILKIFGKTRVEGVRIIDRQGRKKTFSCDGVLITGGFTPESILARNGGLVLDAKTGRPLTDNHGRCSNPVYFAAGNVVHQPVKVAGKCWQHGKITARSIARDLKQSR